MGKLSKASRLEIGTLIALGLLLAFIVLMSPSFSCTLKAYPSVVVWWTDGHAQLRPGCGDVFGRGDVVASFFESSSQIAESLILPAWNTMLSIELLRLVLPLLALAILCSVLYDVLKKKLNEPVSEEFRGQTK
jgi:hypothetical protein